MFTVTKETFFSHSNFKCHVHNWFFIYTLAIAKTTITESKGVDQNGCQRPRLQIKPLAIQKPTHQKPICLLMSALSTAHITQNRDRRNKNTSVSLFANTVTCLPHVTCLNLREISKLLIVSHALDHCNEVLHLDTAKRVNNFYIIDPKFSLTTNQSDQ